MHSVMQLMVFWALAFVTLSVALVLLDIFFTLIGNDLELRSVRTEAAIAGIASLVEGGSVWLVITFLPLAARALIIPALIVALIYKFGHLEDWSRYDILMLLFFQLVLGCFGASLIYGQFQGAITILLGFAVVLAVIAGFARSL
jgi:hypothetical protein